VGDGAVVTNGDVVAMPRRSYEALQEALARVADDNARLVIERGGARAEVDQLRVRLAAMTEERDEARADSDKYFDDADRLEGAVLELHQENDRLTQERDEARAALVRLTAVWVSVGIERDRLRMALEPTAATMAHISAALRDMANWGVPLIEAILAAIRARAGLKEKP
jgi:hypothetical protein